MLSLSAMNAYPWCLFPADEARRIAAKYRQAAGAIAQELAINPQTLMRYQTLVCF
jgi:hypothetical protein